MVKLVVLIVLTFLALWGIMLFYIIKIYIPHKLGALKNNIERQESLLASKEEEIKRKTDEIKEKEKLIMRYESNTEGFMELLRIKPDFVDNNHGKNSDDMEKFITAVLDKYPKGASVVNKNDYFRYQRIGWEAYEILGMLQKYMVSVQGELQKQTPPLSEEQKRKNLAILLDLSMVSYDCITSFYNINARDEQNLNRMVLEGTLTRSDALGKALQVTNVPTETPRWIRVIKESVEQTGAGEIGVIFSGYKL